MTIYDKYDFLRNNRFVTVWYNYKTECVVTLTYGLYDLLVGQEDFTCGLLSHLGGISYLENLEYIGDL